VRQMWAATINTWTVKLLHTFVRALGGLFCRGLVSVLESRWVIHGLQVGLRLGFVILFVIESQGGRLKLTPH
jgi:hypothetical protein